MTLAITITYGLTQSPSSNTEFGKPLEITNTDNAKSTDSNIVSSLAISSKKLKSKDDKSFPGANEDRINSRSDQTINGDPLYILVKDSSQVWAEYNGIQQYYENFYTFLFLNGTSISNTYSSFTPVSNTKPDPWTIVTVFDDLSSNVRITQTISYTNGDKYYTISWSLVNNSGGTYTDCRLIRGGDTYFGGDDSSEGHYDTSLGMVYLTNPDPTVDGLMGFYGHPDTPADHYYEGDYDQNWTNMASGSLPDSTYSEFLDAGYSLQWNNATFSSGATWTITAYEKWTAAGNVQVIAPAPQSADPGDVVNYNFIVQNLQSFSDIFNLSATSSESWSISLTGGNSITIGASSSANISVDLTVPGGLSSGTYNDVLTLTATSQADGNVTNNDAVTTTVIATAPAVSPEINITGNGQAILDEDGLPTVDDHTDFNTTAVDGGTVARTFTIENTGDGDLSLTDSSPYVVISGTNAADFSVTTTPTTPITPAGSTTFQITFDPSATGVRTADISIVNDDADENPYNFTIQGTGTISGCTDSEACNYNSSATVDDGSCAVNDCAGDCGGTAALDDCQICSGGTSGHTANADIDVCDVCPDGTLGTASDATAPDGYTYEDGADCAGDCFGTAALDDCQICSGGTSGHTANADIDACDVCPDGTLGTASDATAPDGYTYEDGADCAGDCFGTAALDDCQICSGGTSGHTANADIDACDVCPDGTLGTASDATAPDGYTYEDGPDCDDVCFAMDCFGECFGSGVICEEGCFLTGDMNGDGQVDVIDVLNLVDMILNWSVPTDCELIVGDISNDSTIGIIDVVWLVEYILGNTNLPMTTPISDAYLILSSRQIKLDISGSVAGIQLEVSGDFIIHSPSVASGWEVFYSDNRIVIISLSGTPMPKGFQFNYSGDLVVQSGIAVDWLGNSVSTTVTLAPDEFTLSSAYPNPFNPVTTFHYGLPEVTHVKVVVYNITGAEVDVLEDGSQQAGYHQIIWNASNQPSGLYLVRMSAGDNSTVQKVLLLK